MKEIDLDNKKNKEKIDNYLNNNEYYKSNQNVYVIDKISKEEIELRVFHRGELQNRSTFKLSNDKLYRYSPAKRKFEKYDKTEFRKMIKDLKKIFFKEKEQKKEPLER